MNDTAHYLQLFFRSTFLPIHYYHKDQCLLILPENSAAFDLTAVYRSRLAGSPAPIDILTTDEFLHFGIVRHPETGDYIITGPVSTSRIPSNRIPFIMNDASVPSARREQVESFFQTMPLFTMDQLICLLCLLYRDLTGETADPMQFFDSESTVFLERIGQDHSSALYHAKEEEVFHNTYHFEQMLFSLIEAGNVAGIDNLYKNTPWLTAGRIGENSLRQEKNIFIASVTLFTRHSIAGGLDIETAYNLSDTYIQASERAQTIAEVNRLSYTAVRDFTTRVAATKIPAGMSREIFECIQFISAHTNQAITLEDVADAVGKSPSHISRRFKKELGFNMSDFIMRKKLEEAKSLLAFTDKPLSEISEYLCFSSQSYFQNVFKKKYGMTPLAFRKSRAGSP